MKVVLLIINDLTNLREEPMKYLKQSLQTSCLLAFAPSAFVQTHEVLMKNRGTGGSIVYEPSYLETQPGDTVKSICKHKSYSVVSIAESSPVGYPGFMGRIDKEIEATYNSVEFYGIKYIPHHAQGIVMLIKVGDVSLPEGYHVLRASGIADGRFQEIHARIDKR